MKVKVFDLELFAEDVIKLRDGEPVFDFALRIGISDLVLTNIERCRLLPTYNEYSKLCMLMAREEEYYYREFEEDSEDYIRRSNLYKEATKFPAHILRTYDMFRGVPNDYSG